MRCSRTSVSHARNRWQLPLEAFQTLQPPQFYDRRRGRHRPECSTFWSHRRRPRAPREIQRRRSFTFETCRPRFAYMVCRVSSISRLHRDPGACRTSSVDRRPKKKNNRVSLLERGKLRLRSPTRAPAEFHHFPPPGPVLHANHERPLLLWSRCLVGGRGVRAGTPDWPLYVGILPALIPGPILSSRQFRRHAPRLRNRES